MTQLEIETTSSTVVYSNRWMSVREDQIRRADGSAGIYGVVEKQDFAVIAAIEDGRIHLVEQFRYPVGARFWELPQGSWETTTTDPTVLARAELKEETGISADNVLHVGRLHEAYGYSTQAFDIFLATGLRAGETSLDPEEMGLISRSFSVADAIDMICRGVITDAVTVASIGLLRLKGVI